MLIGGRCLNTPGALGNQRKKPPRVTTWNRRLQGKATASRFTHPTAEHVQPSLIVMRLEKRLPLSFNVCPGLTVKSLDSQWFIPKIILSKKFKMRKKKKLPKCLWRHRGQGTSAAYTTANAEQNLSHGRGYPTRQTSKDAPSQFSFADPSELTEEVASSFRLVNQNLASTV